MINKVLIANRGEIAKRIIYTCKKMNIKTVVVYSDADKDSLYIKEADESYYIGKSAPAKSYLNIDVLKKAIINTGSDAVHPGYGFLSESAQFAEAVEETGAVWIGPDSNILKNIESKCYCRIIADKLKVPVTPGSIKPITDSYEIADIAHNVGYPILLKLDKGGGGKGIQKIQGNESEEIIKTMFESLQCIGNMAFASDDVYVEKEIINPRHIEIQFFADKYGNVVCFGERECSIQRRYQKVIEESPSAIVTQKERNILYEYTKKIAHEMKYTGAGTIEFLRTEDGKYYFMEINARLQVEHPVSEFVTGKDFVELQIDIADGKKLQFEQSDIVLDGHAIECRIYAEDSRTFKPSPGKIEKLILPDTSSGNVRIDHAIYEGFKVSPFYDPMLAKLIVKGKNRRECINNMIKALKELIIEGVSTTTKVNLAIMRDKNYAEGNFNTSFLDTEKMNIGLDNYVITISRQFGSLGRPIAKKIAEMLDIKYYDRDILDKVIKSANINEDLGENDELAETDSYRRMMYPLGTVSEDRQEKIFEMQKEIIEQIAQKESCVIVGRCSDYILRNHTNHFSIFIYAPYEERRKNCIKQLKIDENCVDNLINKIDNARQSYVMHYAKTYSEDIVYKDILIDSSLYSNIDDTAKIVVDIIRKKFNLS
ncbi:cytidylate kinase family protein [uncultured Clostridium sp.]|uniref:ATP-binding protein n=1 Tax=uncultured Clostridium sp. TaxID=59620 RepID=UPI0025CC7013|nr:cytidylate kinase family protein [uncultured Clostridium sp.]